MKILLCTAEEMMLTTIEFRFRKRNWQLVVGNSAPKALDIARKQFPDCVIVDLQLPEFGGLDIVQHLKKETDGEMPTLVMAPVEDDGLLFEAIRLGAKDFILKPYKPDELILRIRRLLSARKLVG
jgi:DNA-binding response OmpR family regulator